jgi:hypothetical protein
MKIIALKAFTRLTQDAIAVYANQVLVNMSADKQFSNLKTEVEGLKKCADAYGVALVNNINGGRIATLEKDNCKATLLEKLSDIAFLVDFQAKGDEAVILAAGFDVKKPAIAYTNLTPPNVLKIINESEKGVVTVQIEKVLGATVYGIEKRIISENQPDAVWTNGDYTSACKTHLKGLESGKIYQFKFRAIGNKGLVSDWSAMQELLVS